MKPSWGPVIAASVAFGSLALFIFYKSSQQLRKNFKFKVSAIDWLDVERNNITFISFVSKDSDRSILSDSSDGDSSVESDTEESRSSVMSGLSIAAQFHSASVHSSVSWQSTHHDVGLSSVDCKSTEIASLLETKGVITSSFSFESSDSWLSQLESGRHYLTNSSNELQPEDEEEDSGVPDWVLSSEDSSSHQSGGSDEEEEEEEEEEEGNEHSSGSDTEGSSSRHTNRKTVSDTTSIIQALVITEENLRRLMTITNTDRQVGNSSASSSVSLSGFTPGCFSAMSDVMTPRQSVVSDEAIPSPVLSDQAESVASSRHRTASVSAASVSSFGSSVL
jgi:hypothetical protein